MSKTLTSASDASDATDATYSSDAFPAVGNDIFLTIAANLDLHDLVRALRVCRAWRAVLDGTPQLWSAMCERTWASKVYVPASLRAMAGGLAAIEAAAAEERKRLLSSKVRDLKELMRSMHLNDGLVEKGEIADAILDARQRAAEAGTMTERLLRRPLMLVRPGETQPKAALRLSLADAKRTVLKEEELINLTFAVRLRHDGPLSEVLPYDPWWQGQGSGTATFKASGFVTFQWPVDPVDGTPLDPFAAMGMPLSEQGLGWRLDEGRIVSLLFNGHPGPQEIVCRHPRTWGWVLYSQGTCWTSWPMPAMEKDVSGGCPAPGRCSDPLLREEVLRELPSDVQRGF